LVLHEYENLREIGRSIIYFTGFFDRAYEALGGKGRGARVVREND